MRNTRPAGKGDAKGERNGARPQPYVRLGLTALTLLRPVFTRHDFPVSREWLRSLTRTKYLRETVEALVFQLPIRAGGLRHRGAPTQNISSPRLATGRGPQRGSGCREPYVLMPAGSGCVYVHADLLP
jgi:hypothetical protein